MVIFFNSGKNWGGGEKWHYNLAHGFINHGYNAMVIGHPKGELISRCRKNGIPSRNMRVSALSVMNLFQILYLIYIILRFKVVCIITDHNRDLRLIGFVKMLIRRPRIIFRKGSAQPLRNHFLNQFFFRVLKTEFITNSFETRNLLIKSMSGVYVKNPVYVVYSGIDLYEFDHEEFIPLNLQLSDDEIVIGNAGTLSRQKGQHMLIDMAVLLQRENIKFKILIAGEGEFEQKLKLLAHKKNVADKIVFLGYVPNIKSFMRSIDIFVLPSLWEGFGYSMIEAMASAVPVVAFNTSSNPEICGEEQFLAEPFDINEITWHVKQLALDAGLRRKHGDLARERVQNHFNNDSVLRQMMQIVFPVKE